jgi:hypothetical protein
MAKDCILVVLSSALTNGAAVFSNAIVTMYTSTWHHIVQDTSPSIYLYENLKNHVLLWFSLTLGDCKAVA